MGTGRRTAFQSASDQIDRPRCFMDDPPCAPKTAQIPDAAISATKEGGAGERALKGDDQIETIDHDRRSREGGRFDPGRFSERHLRVTGRCASKGVALTRMQLMVIADQLQRTLY